MEKLLARRRELGRAGQQPTFSWSIFRIPARLFVNVGQVDVIYEVLSRAALLLAKSLLLKTQLQLQ